MKDIRSIDMVILAGIFKIGSEVEHEPLIIGLCLVMTFVCLWLAWRIGRRS